MTLALRDMPDAAKPYAVVDSNIGAEIEAPSDVPEGASAQIGGVACAYASMVPGPQVSSLRRVSRDGRFHPDYVKAMVSELILCSLGALLDNQIPADARWLITDLRGAAEPFTLDRLARVLDETFTPELAALFKAAGNGDSGTVPSE